MSEGFVVASWGLYTSIAARCTREVSAPGEHGSKRAAALTLEVTGVGDDNGTSLLEGVERGGHDWGWWWLVFRKVGERAQVRSCCWLSEIDRDH